MASLKKISKFACIAVAACASAFCAVTAGCTLKTNHPTVCITIQFQGEDYNLNYRLYRNMYPQTVQHFIELAQSGFYDNTIIHSYATSGYWEGGYYNYSETQYDALFANGADSGYFNTQSKREAYLALVNSGAITPTVFTALDENGNPDTSTKLPTLYGEFSTNQHTVLNGAITPQFGSLRMSYETQSVNKQVYTVSGKNETLTREYRYNEATTGFSIQTSTSTSSDSLHCTFGILKSDSDSETLTNLQTAISDYITDNLSSTSDFIKSNISADVCYYYYESADISDPNISVTYTVSKLPIIIAKVQVTGY